MSHTSLKGLRNGMDRVDGGKSLCHREKEDVPLSPWTVGGNAELFNFMNCWLDIFLPRIKSGDH